MKRYGLNILLVLTKASSIASAKNNYYSHFRSDLIKQIKYCNLNLIIKIILNNNNFIIFFLQVTDSNILKYNLIHDNLNNT